MEISSRRLPNPLFKKMKTCIPVIECHDVSNSIEFSRIKIIHRWRDEWFYSVALTGITDLGLQVSGLHM